MKKFLLPLFAACVFAAPAIADDAVYGTSPETAKPFPVNGWFLPSLDDAPAEVWFTIKNEKTAPINWGGAPTADERQVFVNSFILKDQLIQNFKLLYTRKRLISRSVAFIVFHNTFN